MAASSPYEAPSEKPLNRRPEIVWVEPANTTDGAVVMTGLHASLGDPPLLYKRTSVIGAVASWSWAVRNTFQGYQYEEK